MSQELNLEPDMDVHGHATEKESQPGVGGCSVVTTLKTPKEYILQYFEDNEQKIKHFLNENQLLKSEVEKLNADLEFERKEKNATEARYCSQKLQIQSIQQTVFNLNKTVAANRTEITSLQQTKLNQETKFKNDVTAWMNRCHKLEKTLEAKNSLLSREQEKSNQLQDQVKAMNAEIDKFRSTHENVRKERDLISDTLQNVLVKEKLRTLVNKRLSTETEQLIHKLKQIPKDSVLEREVETTIVTASESLKRLGGQYINYLNSNEENNEEDDAEGMARKRSKVMTTEVAGTSQCQ